jgi:RNA polymerase sigma-70 factor (ECF subfamily)
MTAGRVFEDHEHLKAWLVVSVRNICRDIFKSCERRNRVDLDELPELAETPPPDTELRELVCALDEKYKLPLYLHYYEGYRTEEIAEMLGVNHATVRTRLRAARKKLRLILEEDEGYAV